MAEPELQKGGTRNENWQQRSRTLEEFRTQRLLTKKFAEDAKSDGNKANGAGRKEVEPQKEDMDQMIMDG
jgi:hypothetical protein